MRIVILGAAASSLLGFRRELLQELAADNELYAVAPDLTPAIELELRGMGVKTAKCILSRSSTNPCRELQTVVNLWQLFRRLTPALYFGYFPKPNTLGVIAAFMAGVPRRFVLIEGLGFYFTERGVAPGWKIRLVKYLQIVLYRLSLPRCEKVFFLNEDDRRELQAAGVKLPDTVILSGIGVDLKHYAASTNYPRRPVFLMVARLLVEKGVREFVTAARIVRENCSDVRFVLIGGLDENPGGVTKAEVDGWVADGLIEWLGHVADVRPAIEQASVFVLPSYREGKPRSTQEAMAMSRPIITTDVIGCRDTVVDGINGFLVPVHNPQALASAMLKFINEPALALSMGRASRHLAEQQYDVHRINAQIMREVGL